MVYVRPTPTTTGFGISGITGNNFDDNLLVTKKYIDELFNSISNTGHYLSGYDVFNYNDVFYPEH
jgi:hypothetical protein